MSRVDIAATGNTPSRHIWFALGLVILATAIAFSPALRGPQLFDDPYAIEANPSIRQLWPISVPLHPPQQIAVSGRPVVNYSFALNYWLNTALGVDQSPDPNGPHKTISYHVVNLLIHLGSGLLLFGIIRRTLWTGQFGNRWATRADLFALLITSLWLLHPLQTDAVDYLVQRTELLVSFFYLATLYCSIRAWDSAVPRSRIRWFAAGTLACLLGMGSKEVMVSAPLIVLLYDRAFRLTSWQDLASPAYRSRRWFYAALAATWILLAALVASGPRNGSVSFQGPIPWWDYLHSQGWAIARYLRLVFLPTALSLDYGRDPIAHWRGVPGLILLTCLGIGTVVAWIRVRRWGWLAFLGSWFFFILAPSSSVVPIVSEFAAERRMHLSLAAVLTAIIIGIDALGAWVKRSRRWIPISSRWNIMPGAIAIMAMAVLGTLTFVRSRLYLSPVAIWRDATEHTPDNPRAWNNLGVLLSDPSTYRLNEADAAYRRAIALDSGYTDARLNLILDELRRHDYHAATLDLQQVPLSYETSAEMAGFGSMVLDYGDTVGATAVFERAAVRPSNVEVVIELATIYRASGRPANAAAALQRALGMAPSRTDLLQPLAESLIKDGRAGEAENYLQRAVSRQPRSPQALTALATVEATLGKRAQAMALFNDALRLDPGNAEARAGLAQLH